MITSTRKARPYPISKKKEFIAYVKQEYMLYLIMIPGLLYFLIFKYIPMYGVTIAFQNYNIYDPSASTFAGFKNFQELFSQVGFQRALGNNIIISLQKLVMGFPIPIIMSLMINELNNRYYKKVVQTSVILPNFVSWVVINGLLFALFSPNMGGIRQIADLVGYSGELPNLLTDRDSFRSVILWSHIWKNAGMGTIVYLAALMGIDSQLYEAAYIDGAGRWKQLRYITLPGITSTIIVLLMFRVGEVMNAGFDQIFAITNPMVNSVADIIDTYVYRIGIQNQQFAIATAAGLFQSVIGLILVLATNSIAKRIDPDSGML